MQTRRGTRQSLIALLFLTLIGLAAYLGKANQLGFFSDDWYLLFGGESLGPAQFWKIFIFDRPLRGVLYFVLYTLLKADIRAYYFLALAIRLLGALGLYWILRLAWKQHAAFWVVAAALFLTYPGFLEQPNAMDYMAQQVALACMIFSIYFSLRYFSEAKARKLACFVLAGGLAFAAYLLMEYYVGIEGYRFLFIGLLLWGAAGEQLTAKLKRIFIAAAPFLAAPAAFVIWRLFIFSGSRSNTTTDFLLSNLSGSWVHSLAEIAKRFLVDAIEVVLGAFVIPLAYVAGRISAVDLLLAAVLGLLGTALLWLYLRSNRGEQTEPESRKKLLTFALLGLAGALFCLLPINIAQREVTYPFFSRFSLPSSIGVAIFLAGMAGQLPGRKLQTGALAALVFLSVTTQYANNVRFSMEWAETQRFWQNMIWRAPDLQDGTTLVGFRTAPIYEGYYIWAPANLLYRQSGEVILSAEVLSRDTLRDIMLKVPYERNLRSIFIRHDYNKLLLFSMPTPSSCLRLIDREQIELSINDDPLIALTAPYSSTAVIGSEDAVRREMFTRIFRANTVEENWCYFYEQAALARQFGDWEQVAQLMEAAEARNLQPGDRVEWMPFIQAYAYLGETEKAANLAVVLSENGFYRLQACTIFESKETTGNSTIDTGNRFLAEQFCEQP